MKILRAEFLLMAIMAACGQEQEGLHGDGTAAPAQDEDIAKADAAQASCSPQAAAGVGACRASVGIFWNGVRCEHQWGCTCEGADCANAYASIETCEDAHAACGTPVMCPTEQIAFTKQDGCQNDGSVEFCIPNNDAALLSTIQAIASSVTCSPGGGRAHCDPSTEFLCFYPTGSGNCLAPHGELTDSAWMQICQIAALPQLTEIVATWFE